MDYKYIEQLLERYWECKTSTEEESILRAFFSQKDIPAPLAHYKALFVYEKQQAKVELGSDFDKRLLEAAGINEEQPESPKVVKAEKVTLAIRLRPLYRAAAAVAIVTLLGTAAQHSFSVTSNSEEAAWDYNQSAYKDSYQDPQKAYEAGMKALQLFKEGPQTAVVDSTARSKITEQSCETSNQNK